MTAGHGSSKAGLGTDELVGIGGAFAVGALAAVKPGSDHYDQEGQWHGEQRRLVVREERLGMPQYTDPHRRRADHQGQGADQAGQAAVEGAAGGQAAPVHGHDQYREIRRGGDAERQADQEGDVLALEQNAEGNRDDAQADGGDARHAHFLLLVGLPFFSTEA